MTVTRPPLTSWSCTGFQYRSASSSVFLSTRHCLWICSQLPVWWLLPRHGRSSRSLRSAETRRLLVSWMQTNFRDKAFSAARPRVWNYQPTDFRQPDLWYIRVRKSPKKDIVVWSVGPKRSVNPPFNCTLESSYWPTFLLRDIAVWSSFWTCLLFLLLQLLLLN